MKSVTTKRPSSAIAKEYGSPIKSRFSRSTHICSVGALVISIVLSEQAESIDREKDTENKRAAFFIGLFGVSVRSNIAKNFKLIRKYTSYNPYCCRREVNRSRNIL